MSRRNVVIEPKNAALISIAPNGNLNFGEFDPEACCLHRDYR